MCPDDRRMQQRWHSGLVSYVQLALQDLNAMMKDYMDGLSVKVFRTYNASVTLDRLLWEPSQSQGLPAMQGDYHRANKEVCLLYVRGRHACLRWLQAIGLCRGHDQASVAKHHLTLLSMGHVFYSGSCPLQPSTGCAQNPCQVHGDHARKVRHCGQSSERCSGRFEACTGWQRSGEWKEKICGRVCSSCFAAPQSLMPRSTSTKVAYWCNGYYTSAGLRLILNGKRRLWTP